MKNLYRRKNYWDLFKVLVHAELLQRYQGSMLGFLWVLLKPLLIFGVLYEVFQVFNQGNLIPHFPLYLLLGVLTFNYFNEGTSLGMLSVLNKSHILKKVAFERYLAVLASVTHAFINYLLSLIVFFVVAVLSSVHFSVLSILVWVMYVLCLTIFILAIGFFLSLLVVWFRDIISIWEVLLSVLFYLTPVFYPISIIPERILGWYKLNPLVNLITGIRESLLYANASTITDSLAYVFFIFILFLAGMFFFRKFSPNITQYL